LRVVPSLNINIKGTRPPATIGRWRTLGTPSESEIYILRVFLSLNTIIRGTGPPATIRQWRTLGTPGGSVIYILRVVPSLNIIIIIIIRGTGHPATPGSAFYILRVVPSLNIIIRGTGPPVIIRQGIRAGPVI
jgi:hypothetical protein